MNNYKSKREAKARRFDELAAKQRSQSKIRRDAVRATQEAIPFGQPILVGHHSERGHRAALSRMNNNMHKSIEHDSKAEYYENKAENARNNTAIFSDDPEAVRKLKEKIAKSENTRDKWKAIRAEFKKCRGDVSKMTLIKEEDKARIQKAVDDAPSYDKNIVPSYLIKNMTQNIRMMKKRLATLQEQKGMESKKEKIGIVTVFHNVEENRLQLFFPDKPEEEMRKALKSAGFRWSPTNKTWQRHLNNAAIYSAKRVLSFTERKD